MSDNRITCVECAHVTSEGVDPVLRRRGLSHCKVIPLPTGTHFSVLSKRLCEHFRDASPEDVAARRAWLASVANPLSTNPSAPSSPGQP